MNSQGLIDTTARTEEAALTDATPTVETTPAVAVPEAPAVPAFSVDDSSLYIHRELSEL